MNSYVITYCDGMPLLTAYETIQGNTPKDALKRKYNKDFRRVTGDESRYADVILQRGYMRDERTLITQGNQTCYRIMD
jgi:hypothetical protein